MTLLFRHAVLIAGIVVAMLEVLGGIMVVMKKMKVAR